MSSRGASVSCSPTAGQPGHLLCAERSLCRCDRALRPGAAAPGGIVDLERRVLGGHEGIIHFTVGQRRGLGVTTRAPRSSSVGRSLASCRRRPREALRTSRIGLPEVNWLGAGTVEEALQERVPRFCVKVRSTRPPRPAWLRSGADGSLEVELIGTEGGVSPGRVAPSRGGEGPGARARRRIRGAARSPSVDGKARESRSSRRAAH